MSDLWDMPIATLLDDISGVKPTPGGGAASILSGLVGLSLVRMAANVTIASLSNDELNHQEKTLAALESELKTAAAADMEAFASYMRAIKMPKDSPEAEQARGAALDEATLAAAKTPQLAAELLLSALQIAAKIHPQIKKNIVSDLYCGCELLNAAIRSVLYNVDINLTSKRLANQKATLLNGRTKTLNEASALYAVIEESAHADGFITR